MAVINCAVYVRKSTEHGLEQEFNSLHNQEEAGKNYILSQAFQGWEYYKTYSDGGISGGTMERPGLQQMLDDMRQGLVNVVVVYKVDRLSRSILDFHTMMKTFDKYNCNFVSITQSFDTSNSMGKLTLNMLLSFAQFEREVSSERVRDKIRASKAKGLWTGGFPMLGYDIIDKKLVPNPIETKQVIKIFEKYLELKSIAQVHNWAVENNLQNKQWTAANGRIMGGGLISKTTISKMLNNSIYIGKITHKGIDATYDGQHPAIIPKALFTSVQELLKSNNNRNTKICEYNGYLLNNKVMDNNGKVFKNQKTSANKKNKYRYYSINGKYLPAGDVENITRDVVFNLLNSDLSGLLPDDKIMAIKTVEYSTANQKIFLDLFIKKIVYSDNQLTYFFNTDIPQEFQAKNYINSFNNPQTDKVYTSGDGDLILHKDIIVNDRVSTNRYEACGKSIITKSEYPLHLIKALAIGWRYNNMLKTGMSVDRIREQEHTAQRTVYKYLNLAYLSPKIINSIMDSMIPDGLNLQKLFQIADAYPDFVEQEKVFYS